MKALLKIGNIASDNRSFDWKQTNKTDKKNIRFAWATSFVLITNYAEL